MVPYLLWKWEVLADEACSMRREIMPMILAAKEHSVRLWKTGSFEWIMGTQVMTKVVLKARLPESR